MLTFIEAENPYFRGNVVLAADDQNEGRKTDWSIEGTFEVDYEKGRIKITNYDGSIYFGIFEIDESGDRARLKIEYQKDSYPTGFSSKAFTYIERTNLPRRDDASSLGLINSLYTSSNPSIILADECVLTITSLKHKGSRISHMDWMIKIRLSAIYKNFNSTSLRF